MATSKVSLKLLIDTKSSRVLYAEAGKDFVDFLVSLLHLPVVTVIRLIKDSMVGSLSDLYESIENLTETYWQPNHNKESLLQPQTPLCASGVPMLLPSDISTAKMFYTCPNNCECRNSYQLYVCDDSSTSCPGCNRSMSKEAAYVSRTTANEVSAGKGGFVQGVVTYMVMDDLVVKPMSGISSITLLNKFNIKDLSALEEKVVDFGMDEGLKLLKASLQTKTVLTSIFLGNTGVKVE
ncbi:uncharacterized protein LOC130775221 [Actinidia eriantha]|uniref:uncharacterized protein LOC130775221 n=1 Tax=Actinidia eriantha TaxID=165200 RepID=UPI002587D283|nr:uncharacterized protein LOC130775221 [Actinidia eriantha]